MRRPSTATGRTARLPTALLKYIRTPGLEVRQMISRVRAEVLAATQKKQVPWDNSSLLGDVYLVGARSCKSAGQPPLQDGTATIRDDRGSPRRSDYGNL